MMNQLQGYKNRKVFITGHTGFKGSWLTQLLNCLEADIVGYSLLPPASPNIFESIALPEKMKSLIGDIRDLGRLQKVFLDESPEIVFHLAAQPLVRESYKNPVATYETNVMGTVNILECIRCSASVKSFVNVTTDKVYKNNEWVWGYRENEELGGFDPYSNSKSCSELVTGSYTNSFLSDRNVAVSTARAGNVIGGGDFAADRIIPDCIRAALTGETIIIRNPDSVRPFQHVLEPLIAYLMIGSKQLEDNAYAGSYNVGPDEKDCVTAGELADIFCDKWKKIMGKQIQWKTQHDGGPHEANYLKLDCSKLKTTFDWKPVWNIEEAVEKTVEWMRVYTEKGDLAECMRRQIQEYIQGGLISSV